MVFQGASLCERLLLPMPAQPSCSHSHQKLAPKYPQSKLITISPSSLIEAILKFSKLVGRDKKKTNNGSNYPHCLMSAFLPAFHTATLRPQCKEAFCFYGFRQHIISPGPSSEMRSTGEQPRTQRDVPRTPSPPLPPPAPHPAHGLFSPTLRRVCLFSFLPVFPSSLRSSNMLLTNHLRSSQPGCI